MAFKIPKRNPLIGRKIVDVRPMTAFEQNQEGWETRHKATRVLVLDNGDKIYPSSDDEGNDAGTLFGMDKKGKTFYVI